MKKILFFAPIILIYFAACTKYPDGPSMTIYTKKYRLSNSWVITKVLENGADKTGDYQTAYKNYNLVLDKANNYSLSYSPYGFGTYSESGGWTLSGDKNYLILNPSSNNNSDSSWKIYRLTAKEFWAYDADFNGKTLEVHFVPK